MIPTYIISYQLTGIHSYRHVGVLIFDVIITKSLTDIRSYRLGANSGKSSLLQLVSLVPSLSFFFSKQSATLRTDLAEFPPDLCIFPP